MPRLDFRFGAAQSGEPGFAASSAISTPRRALSACSGHEDISKSTRAVEPVRWIPSCAAVRPVEAAFAAVAATRRLRLSVVATRAWVNSDPLLLERILFNLVSNAVRYTERGGAVLGVRRRGAFVAIDVCDSGIGISAVEHEHIFDEFYQVDAEGRRGKQGMGLGLAIIRRLAAPPPNHSRSNPRRRGSRFSILVPRAMPDAAQGVATASRHRARPSVGRSLR